MKKIFIPLAIILILITAYGGVTDVEFPRDQTHG
jgi:hypothetical protein